ncbi:hypothetical protein FB567DRAFT_116521 [Paraphoma chrysanthemicola]|uniref:Uncharacterized protein n=1 Tax=Paraphoma chrysanthemicola TaxID=798071 RepID=A0A8K0VVF9_9PLEO|nr:hypothetical protein FB567DRAFT_116521 [Paraphoma chrysanthemicola]
MSTADRLSSSSVHVRRSAVLRQLKQANRQGNKRTSDASDLSNRDPVEFFDDNDSTLEVPADDAEHEEQSGRLSPNANLDDVRAWLDGQAKKELSRVDWTPEYDRQRNRAGPRPENDNFFEGLDTKVLERIRRRKGPRPARFEDLLAPLRLHDGPIQHRRPIKESYQEMAAVIQTWNQHVAPLEEDLQARETLMIALRELIHFLNTSAHKRHSADAHERTSRHLLAAIHAYRTETAIFETKQSPDLLIIILAHVGFAIPDIDDDLKYLIFYALVTERLASAHAVNAERRAHLEDNIARAKQAQDLDLVETSEKKLRDWVNEGFCHEAEVIASRIKAARHRVWLKGVDDLQDLVALQVAQKMALENALASPNPQIRINAEVVSEHRAALVHTLENTSGPIDPTILHHLDETLLHATTALETVSDMRSTNQARVLTRAIKFAGYDLYESEREEVVAQRMAHPDTARMMRDAVEGMMETKEMAGRMVESLEMIDNEVEEMRGRVERLWEGYERLEGLVEGKDVFGCEDMEDGAVL